MKRLLIGGHSLPHYYTTMFSRLLHLQSLARHSSRLLQPSPLRFNYISKKALDEIGKEHGDGVWSQTKMYTRQAKLIMTEGMIALKRDIGKYMDMRKRLSQEHSSPTEEDQKLMEKIRREARRLKTMIIIQILPMSGPILLYYLYTYPNQIPSWFCIDQIYDNYQRQCIEKQLQRIEEFRINPLDTQNFTTKGMDIEQLKRISELLYGHYDDGVIGINKMFKNKQREYMIHPQFSKHLVKRTLKKEFKIENKDDPVLSAMEFDELILWKYDRVMNHGDRLSFTPALEHESLEAQEEIQEEPQGQKQQPLQKDGAFEEVKPQQMSQAASPQLEKEQKGASSGK